MTSKATEKLSVQELTAGQNELHKAISAERRVIEALQKFAQTKGAASTSLMKWATMLQDPLYKELFMRMADLEDLWSKVLESYVEEFSTGTQLYRDIELADKALQDSKKQADELKSKMDKMQKQLGNVQKKVEAGKEKKEKLEVAQDEVKQMQTMEASFRSNLDNQIYNYKINKHKQIRHALLCMNQASRKAYEKALEVTNAQKTIMNAFLPSSTEFISQDGFQKAVSESESLIASVTQQIQMPHPRRYSELEAGATFVSHQFQGVTEGNTEEGNKTSPSITKRPLPPVPSPASAQGEEHEYIQMYEPLKESTKHPYTNLSAVPDKQNVTGSSKGTSSVPETTSKADTATTPQKLEMSQSTTEFVSLVGELPEDALAHYDNFGDVLKRVPDGTKSDTNKETYKF